MEAKKGLFPFSIENLLAEKHERRPLTERAQLHTRSDQALQYQPGTHEQTEASVTPTGYPQVAPQPRGVKRPGLPDSEDKENGETDSDRASPGVTSSVSDTSAIDILHENSAPRRKKKARTSFSNDQLMELEKRYRLQKYVGADDRSRLADELGLSDQQVKTWFQNRRMKEKRHFREVEQLQGIPFGAGMLPVATSMTPGSSIQQTTMPVPVTSVAGSLIAPYGYPPFGSGLSQDPLSRLQEATSKHNIHAGFVSAQAGLSPLFPFPAPAMFSNLSRLPCPLPMHPAKPAAS